MNVWERLARRIRHPSSWLERLYEDKDPWKMSGGREQFRFKATNEIIEREIGTIGTLIEYGSGEGHQTKWLKKVARTVVGIEVSTIAVKRAQQRVSDATFIEGDMRSYYGEYDVATIFEILYYIPENEIENTLALIGSQAKTIVASQVLRGDHKKIVSHFPADAKQYIIEYSADGTKWIVAIWKIHT